MFKKLLLLSALLILNISLQAQITYIDYGSGLIIPIDAKYEMDIDNDGLIDFYINGIEGELGFIPIPAKGCFTSPSEFATTSWGARQLDLHDFGELISLTPLNSNTYIDEGRGAVFSVSSGLASGWTDNQDLYVGFANFSDDFLYVSNGWMKVRINVEEKQLIVKEMAFTDFHAIGFRGIKAGDNGLTTHVTEIEKIPGSVSLSPNPSHGFTNISFDLEQQKINTLKIYSETGILIETKNLNFLEENDSISLNTQDWDNGIYFILMESNEGKIITERLIVSH